MTTPIAISDIVLVEPTYNATQVLAMNQAWWNNVYQFGIIVFMLGMIIGGALVYLRFRYGSSQ